MCSNYSLSICFLVSAIIHRPARGVALQALRFWISSSGTSWGPIVDIFYVDGGCSRTFSSGTSWGSIVDVFYVDGGCARTFSSNTS
jgi:hypothetical protein